ncbi:predicted protein [Chaetoceros tenuissimus]|uniref:Uncharacterized protein n=1 Tax=Chaetoceros tenuissimus TaxID=426638 RepID=A0AAD3HF98_9STRA|nr:predicted protein [Chaetoceros tenuissimus]
MQSNRKNSNLVSSSARYQPLSQAPLGNETSNPAPYLGPGTSSGKPRFFTRVLHPGETNVQDIKQIRYLPVRLPPKNKAKTYDHGVNIKETVSTG